MGQNAYFAANLVNLGEHIQEGAGKKYVITLQTERFFRISSVCMLFIITSLKHFAFRRQRLN
ncbi:hypothetical protein GGQ92_002172 [Gracilibacillus halotolerans]|uniref:Uncharacterized protein n=1 Tax=Gracilibacillus halotolerans TaxID=74386 RepID=A0A841RR08_9BACI|nr:hypothetical protein [Gracilibacillus halotolerans]